MNNNEITKRVNHRKYGYKKQVQDIAKARFNEMKAYINEEDKILDRALEMAERIENKIKVRTSEQEWKTVSQLASKLDDLNSEIRKHYNYFEKVRIFANKINSIKLEELSVNEIADLLEEYYELTKGSNKNFENNVKKIKVKVKPATLAEVSKKKIIPKIKNVRVANVIDSTNDDDLELENQITEIEKLVKEAEETVTEESILKAKEALSKLEDQSIKNEFFNRLIKVREKLLRELIEAENSFRNAKYSLDNDEILEASDKINALKDSNKKESLVKELISFKQKIDMLNEMLVSLRQKMIWKKEPITELEMRELEKCYNEVSINDENEYFGLVQDIKNYYNKEKNKASTPMPEQENNQSEYENQILKVEKLVKEAEEKMDKESISKAKEAVFKLEDQTIKNEFFNRLDDINIKLLDELNEAKKAFEEAKKTLNEDRILAASNKINALRDSEDKASLVKEIDTFKEKIVAFADILEELKKKRVKKKLLLKLK